jgi:hypothetical protein
MSWRSVNCFTLVRTGPLLLDHDRRRDGLAQVFAEAIDLAAHLEDGHIGAQAGPIECTQTRARRDRPKRR